MTSSSEKIALVLANLNSTVDTKQKRTGWVVSTCPFAPWTHEGGRDRKPSFGVATTHPHIYKCFSCNEVGALDALVFNVREHWRASNKPGYAFGKALAALVADDDDLPDLPDFDEKVITDPNEVLPWPDYWLDSFKSVFAFPEAKAYLASRDVPEHVSNQLDLRYDSSRKRVCFPVRDYDGRLVGMQGRAIDDHPLRYYAYRFEGHVNKIPWLGEQWVDFERPVLLVESVFDLASCLRVYDNVIAPLSVGLSKEKIKRIDRGLMFVTMFDVGTGGDSARDTIERRCRTPVKNLTPPQDDPGDCTVSELTESLGAYLELTNTNN